MPAKKGEHKAPKAAKAEKADADEGEKTPADALQAALESLLSKRNLVRDPVLAESMNPQMYIPIRVLLGHEKLAGLASSEAEVAGAAERSARLAIDDARQMVRPLLKSRRNVIILRDCAEGVTEEEVRELFAGAPHAEKMASVKAEVNNTWFVKMDLEDGTQEVVLWLRSQKLKDKSVNASIKSEHFLRSFFPLNIPAAQDAGFPAQMAGAGPGFPAQMSYMGDSGGGAPGGYGNGGMIPPWMQQQGGYDGGGYAGGAPQMPMGGGPGGKGGKGKFAPEFTPAPQQWGPPPAHAPFGPQPPGYWQPWGRRLGQEELPHIQVQVKGC